MFAFFFCWITMMLSSSQSQPKKRYYWVIQWMARSTNEQLIIAATEVMSVYQDTYTHTQLCNKQFITTLHSNFPKQHFATTKCIDTYPCGKKLHFLNQLFSINSTFISAWAWRSVRWCNLIPIKKNNLLTTSIKKPFPPNMNLSQKSEWVTKGSTLEMPGSLFFF